MPVGIPDVPGDTPADSGGGGGATGRGGSAFGDSQSAAFQPPASPFGAIGKRQQVFRGIRGLGDNIPIVARSRGFQEGDPGVPPGSLGGGGVGGGSFNPTGFGPVPGSPQGAGVWTPEQPRLGRPRPGGFFPPPGAGGGGGAPPPPVPNEGGGFPLGDPNMPGPGVVGGGGSPFGPPPSPWGRGGNGPWNPPEQGRLGRPGGGGAGRPPIPPYSGPGEPPGPLTLGDPGMRGPGPGMAWNRGGGGGGFGGPGGVPGAPPPEGYNFPLDIPRFGRPHNGGAGRPGGQLPPNPRPPGGPPPPGGGDSGGGPGGGPITPGGGGVVPGGQGGYGGGPPLPPPSGGGIGGTGIEGERVFPGGRPGAGRGNTGGGSTWRPPGPPAPPPGGGGGGGGGIVPGGTGGGAQPWTGNGDPLNDQNGEPIRYIRPTQTRGGNQGSYGPGGGFAGWAGASPDLTALGGGLGQEDYAMQRRYPSPYGFAHGGFVPGVEGGPPAPSDTVSAKLTPGEMVMNRGVMSDPTIAAVLTLLNILGASKQQSGMGMEDDSMEECPMCGGMKPKAEVPDEQGYACGGHVKGYATGGWANFGSGNRWAGIAGGMQQPKAPQQPLGGAQPAGGNGYTYNPEGGVTGGYNPANPWGQMTQNRDTRTYGQANRTLGEFGEAGYFDPRGNQMLINSQNEAARGTADALVRRNMAAADLSGLDPAQRAVAKLQALRDTGRGVQDIMAQTRADALGAQDAWAKNLYGTLLSGDLGFTGADQQAKLQDYLANQAAQRAKKGQWGNVAGQVIGGSVGGYLGGRGGKP